MKIKPITPNDASIAFLEAIPDVVIETFNEFICNINSNSITIKQDDIVNAIIKKGISRDEIFLNHWLDVEKIYEEAGWKVEYDKPAYNESYPATFTFTPKAK